MLIQPFSTNSNMLTLLNCLKPRQFLDYLLMNNFLVWHLPILQKFTIQIYQFEIKFCFLYLKFENVIYKSS